MKYYTSVLAVLILFRGCYTQLQSYVMHDGDHRRSQEGPGGPPPNCNASNDKFARKKVIVALVSLLDLLSDRENLFFLSSPNFWDKIGPSIHEDLFFGLHIIFGTKLTLRSVKTFLCFCICLGLHCVSCGLALPQSEIKLQLHFAPLHQSKFLATPMMAARFCGRK